MTDDSMPNVISQLMTVLSDRYEIERELGAGADYRRKIARTCVEGMFGRGR